MSTTNLMVGSGFDGGYTSADLKLLPTPVATTTHHPVAFHVLDDIMQHRIRKEFGAEIVIEPEYALNKKQTQFFGVYGIHPKEGGGRLYPAVALRSSIDKTLQPKAAGGAKVGACTNTMIWGDLLEVCRKQTANSMADIEMMIVRIMTQLESHFHSAEIEVEVMRDHHVTTDRGFGVLGQLYGNGVLTPNQSTRAFSEWKKPKIEEFMPRSAWSLYNAVTGALKIGQPGHMMGRFTRLHQNFRTRYVHTTPAERDIQHGHFEIDVN